MAGVKAKDKYIYIYTYVYVYIYMYIYIYRVCVSQLRILLKPVSSKPEALAAPINVEAGAQYIQASLA